MTLLGVAQVILGVKYLGRSGEGVWLFVARRSGPIAGMMRWSGISAYTLGAVVTYRELGLATQARLYRHEYEHVLQTSRLGPLMPLAYAGASLWAVLRGKHLYRDNWFEVRARAAEHRPIPLASAGQGRSPSGKKRAPDEGPPSSRR